MRRLTVYIVASLAAVSLVFAASKEKKGKGGGAGDEQAIMRMEEEWTNALVKGDLAAIDRIVTSDWMLTTPTGQLLTKEQADADLKSGTLKFESVKTDDLKVKVHGDVALVFGLETEKSTFRGKDMSGQYRFTDVFLKRAGRWQCIATHVSKVAASPAATKSEP